MFLVIRTRRKEQPVGIDRSCRCRSKRKSPQAFDNYWLSIRTEFSDKFTILVESINIAITKIPNKDQFSYFAVTTPVKWM